MWIHLILDAVVKEAKKNMSGKRSTIYSGTTVNILLITAKLEKVNHARLRSNMSLQIYP